MRDPIEVLRRKEAELAKLQEEIEALRLVGKLLQENSCTPQGSPSPGKVIQMPDIYLA